MKNDTKGKGLTRLSVNMLKDKTLRQKYKQTIRYVSITVRRKKKLT